MLYLNFLTRIDIYFKIYYTDGNKEGTKKSELVAWYLDKIQDQIESEEELLERKSLVEKIIDRLIYHVCLLITRIRIY